VEDLKGIKHWSNALPWSIIKPKMPSKQPSLRKRLNKKKKRTLPPLKSKCREFAKLPGVNLALFIEFDMEDRDHQTKKKIYTLRTTRKQSFLRNIDAVVSVVSIACAFL
jgi:hypothetical protein